MPRKEQHRRLKTRYAVLGDGQTEQYYLKHLKSIHRYKYSVYPSLFSDTTIENVEGKIDELRSGGCDLIIYFTDYDIIIGQNKQEKFESVKRKYLNIPEIIICETMPSFEFWFLLHYKKTTKEFANANEVITELKKFISNYSKSKSFLENQQWVKDLIESGKQNTAIRYAEEILEQKERDEVGIHFPYTRAHLGINKFEQHKGCKKRNYW
jgi:hypothetical protein